MRSPNGISFTFSTAGLTQGHVYTIWFVAFNEPGECIDGCGSDDVMAGRAGSGSLWGAGHVVGGAGRVTFSGQRRVGEAADPALGEVGSPLLNPTGAEILLVLRTHGSRSRG